MSYPRFPKAEHGSDLRPNVSWIEIIPRKQEGGMQEVRQEEGHGGSPSEVKDFFPSFWQCCWKAASSCQPCSQLFSPKSPTLVVLRGADSVGPVFCALPGSEQLR